MITKSGFYWITGKRYKIWKSLDPKNMLYLDTPLLWEFISDSYNEETETSKCGVVHGGSIFTWTACDCDGIFTKVTYGYHNQKVWEAQSVWLYKVILKEDRNIHISLFIKQG